MSCDARKHPKFKNFRGEVKPDSAYAKCCGKPLHNA